MRERTQTVMTSVPRPGSSLAAFWVLTGFGALLLGDAVVRGDWGIFGLSLAPACLVVWLGWTLLYRPEIRFDVTHVVVVNPGRIHRIPWERVSEVGQRLQITFETDDGKRTTCWGSPFPEKPGLRRRTPSEKRFREPGSALVGALDASRRNSSSAGSSGAPVERRWDVIPLGVGAALAVVCIVEFLITR
jgi:hypothetical protein